MNNRHRSTYDKEHALKRGPDGWPLCRWCGTRTPGKRRTFCNEANCLHQWLIRSNGPYARQHVFIRDQGVCALCQLDTGRLNVWANKEVRRLATMTPDQRRASLTKRLGSLGTKAWNWRHVELYRAIVEFEGRVYDVPVHWFSSGREVLTLWQMDHIVPVAEGGGDCGLENLRTLCLWCHGRESGALRRRLNQKKKALGPETSTV